MAPSKVPAGQMYLQKPGTARSWRTPYHEDHIFEIAESAGHAALGDLGSRDLVQELLDQAQRAQPSADRSAKGQPEDHDNAQNIPAGTVSGIGGSLRR